MKQSRFTEERIIGILEQQETGLTVAALCREHGIGENTFYTWKRKFGGMSVSEARRLRQLEEENTRLKKLLAERAPFGQAGQRRPQGCAVKNGEAPAQRAPVNAKSCNTFRVSMASRSGGLAVWCRGTGPASVTIADEAAMTSCGSGCTNWPKSVLALATSASGCCCAARE